MKTMSLSIIGMLIGVEAVAAVSRTLEAPQEARSGWKTNFTKRSVDLKEIKSGGPPKDGIPAIDAPRFISSTQAAAWLAPKEPVIALEVNGEAKAYPMQILIWHEIVNDRVGEVPVTVTFCPLCHSAVVFDRRLDDRTYDFGVSGSLRHSDLIMYDRQTESWWQQVTGEAIVGDLTGKRLHQVPSQIVSFREFAAGFPDGKVLSRETGHHRQYGRNPYVGYDDVDSRPFLYDGPKDGRLRPMERIVVVTLNGRSKAYPYSVTSKTRALHDRIGHQDLVVFHAPGTASALDRQEIAASRDVGATGVFKPSVDGRRLTFEYRDGAFTDRETLSTWNTLGQCVSGKLAGRRLEPMVHSDFFAFAWLAFQPSTEVYHPSVP